MNFYKSNTCGNDFVFIPNDINDIKKIQQICHRKFGIGCDQLIVIPKYNIQNQIKIFNSDGSLATMCGNAMIAIADKYLLNNTQQNISIYNAQNQCLIGKKNHFSYVQISNITVDEDIVNVGNLHKIFIIKDNLEIDYIPSSEYNKSYIKILSKTEIFVTTIERGSGLTMCCGSGICASVFYLCNLKLLTEKQITVITDGSIISNTEIKVIVNDKITLFSRSNNTFEGVYILKD